jgi:hypothetical protein
VPSSTGQAQTNTSSPAPHHPGASPSQPAEAVPPRSSTPRSTAYIEGAARPPARDPSSGCWPSDVLSSDLGA